MAINKSLKKQSSPSRHKTVEDVEIQKIRRDGGTQPRARLDEGTVHSYAESISDGDEFPPITLFYDGESYWLADGFHRVQAHIEACKETIAAEVRSGTRRDAVLYCVGANATHGLRRSNADKRRAVETLLNDPEWHKWSNNEIASRSNVSHTFVRNVRDEMSNEGSASSLEDLDAAPESRFARRGGTTYTVQTKRIGQSAGTPLGRQRKKKKPIVEPEPEPVLNKLKKVASGEIWSLGKHHKLYCGSHSSQKFQSLLPNEIALLLVFPSEPTEWLPRMPQQAKSALMWYTPYGEDMHLETLRNVVSNCVTASTDADDNVIVLNLPDPSLFLLFDELQCKCYCAEPNPQRCTDAITAWSVTQQSVQKR
ncbi:hypothetical protein C1752_10569 [Acaryochloris thomasi RCC1774]|uniref:ParB-like N-terminal domain-containing protein n=1 Tax=Acaryochloris thomasi RCC1774 TaxID=1764569 RepID=A0A2W1JHE0_9CYAN|nr:streptomycin biosynthesis regulator [Acaryochloris thomasi]PZD70562.1 hypothetical protein C1752_10569 [Acaryochloris thomasi RCC1774]